MDYHTTDSNVIWTIRLIFDEIRIKHFTTLSPPFISMNPNITSLSLPLHHCHPLPFLSSFFFHSLSISCLHQSPTIMLLMMASLTFTNHQHFRYKVFVCLSRADGGLGGWAWVVFGCGGLGGKCKTRKNSNFRKKGKIVILVKIQNFSRSQMTKRTSPLELSRKI